MGRPELGTKCNCVGCHERFYDLHRSPAICPKCGATQPPEAPRALRAVRASPSAKFQMSRQPAAVVDDEVEPANTSDVDLEDDVPEPDDDDDIDDDIEIDPDLVKAAD